MRLVCILLVLTLTVLPAFAADKESTYDRVMRTGTIRCGYMSGDPYFMKDPLTGKMSGIWYEYVEEMGKWLGLNIDWAEETGLGDLAVALDSGRIDAFCVGLWVNPTRAKVVDFVVPITYQIVNAYVRNNDARFDADMNTLNDPAITVSCLDGELAATIAQEDYPQAKTACLPQLSPFSDMFMNVMQGKADVTFGSPAAVAQFNKTNKPGLRKVPSDYPIRVFPESIVVSRGSDDLRRVLDHTTNFLINNGKIETIIKKYSKSSDDFMRVVKTYTTN